MECPKCRSEVVDWHYYCSNCHALVNDVDPDAGKSKQSLVERAGARLLNLLVVAFVIGLIVLMARAIKWGDLVNSIRGEMNSVIEAKEQRLTPAKPQTVRRPNVSSSPTHNESSSKSVKAGKVESVRSLQQKIEELPSLDESPQLIKPAPIPRSASAPPTLPPDSVTLQNPAPPVRPQKNGAELDVEHIEVKHGGQAGYIAIDSYVPARIYVDGQFSGLTPRTVKLSVGDHQIRLIAEGYEDWTRRVKLGGLQQVGLMASMKKKVTQ